MAYVDLNMTDEDAREDEERARRELEERRAQAAALVGDVPEMPRVEMPESPSRPGQAAEVIGEAERASGRMSAPAALHRADGTTQQVPPQPLSGRVAEVDARLSRPGGARAVESEMRREAVTASRPAPMARPAETSARPAPMAPPPSSLRDDGEPDGARPPRRVSLGDEPVMQIAPSRPAAERPTVQKPRELPRPTGADALDAGLPSEADIARERGIDVPRRILHNIANAMRAMGRSPSRQFESRGDALAEQRSEGLASRMNVKRQDVQRQSEAAQEGAELAAETDIASRRLASQEAAQLRDDERQSMVAQEQRGLLQSRRSLLDEQTATAQRSSSRDAMLDDPESEASDAARRALRVRVASLPESQRSSIARELGEIDNLTGREALAYLEHGRLPQPPQARVGAGRGGGAPAGTARGTDDEALVRDAMEILGMTEGSARAAIRDDRARRGVIRQLGTQGTRDRMADESARIPGYTRRPDARRLSAQQARSVSDIATADREFRSIVQMLERDLSSLSPAERAGGVAGLGSERYARIQHGLDVIRNQFRQINSAGNSLGAQQMAEHAIPDLTARTTVEALLANVRAAQEVKHRYVAAVLEQYGYEPESGGHGGGHTGTAPAERTITMTLPDGSTRRVPERAVAAAERRGWRASQ